MNKRKLWLLIADKNHPHIHLVLPTICWMAEENGADFECYLECNRDGEMFASNGSMILSGNHFQQFNYLNIRFDVNYIILGDTAVFSSSIKMFEGKVLAEENTVIELYNSLIKQSYKKIKKNVLFVGNCKKIDIDLGPYIYPEIYFNKYIALPEGSTYNSEIARRIYTDSEDSIDNIETNDTYGTLTMRIAGRNKSKAGGVAFGDPSLIISQIPKLCREKRVAVYGDLIYKTPKEIKFSGYTEACSEIAKETAVLAEEIGNKLIVGRQTCDGDLFEWSKKGICIQILDPNRPPFPIVETLPQMWYSEKSYTETEPDDAQLEKYADEGRILCSIVAHSGEVAHNEAMLNLMEFSSIMGLKMGLGVHAQRYNTCPQLWDLINIPSEKGGMLGNIEPILHAGGMGVLAENNCPEEDLKKYINMSLNTIKETAGDKLMPHGYYAFCDTDLKSLQTVREDVFKAVEECGLEYFITSAKPGINKLLYTGENLTAINQSARAWCGSSPFVRISTYNDIKYYSELKSPGWYIVSIDSPVVSFIPNIWRRGNEFAKIVEWMTKSEHVINVIPHVISRYIKILIKRGFYNKK